jgi:hypothetical protein
MANQNTQTDNSFKGLFSVALARLYPIAFGSLITP